ncbi:hypothetical protein HRG_015125 [Hirsutella rhossiliensis]
MDSGKTSTSNRKPNGLPNLAEGPGDGRRTHIKPTGEIPYNPDPNAPGKSNLRTTCLKRDGCGQLLKGSKPKTPPIKFNSKSASAAWGRLKAARGFRVVGVRTGKAAAFSVLAPLAHDLLDTMKRWDHPVGLALTWFDDAMTSFQRAIGGEQVPEIYGNELKLRFICWLRGEQYFKNDVDYACGRLREKDKREDELEEQPQEEDTMVEGLNKLIESCETIEDHPPDDEELLTDLITRCNALISKAFKVDGKQQPTAKDPKGMFREKHWCLECTIPAFGTRCRCITETKQAAKPEEAKSPEAKQPGETKNPFIFKGPPGAEKDFIDPNDVDHDIPSEDSAELAKYNIDPKTGKTWGELGKKEFVKQSPSRMLPRQSTL